jgi:aspartate aminotransferase
MDKLSIIGNGIVGSEIIKISQQIKEISKTKSVQNLTIGDFDSRINPIPALLKDQIIKCYEEDLTNYPLSAGELNLRKSVSTYLSNRQGIKYSENEILIGGGVRPLIYTIFKSIVDEGESVLYPVPSWNNNHYSFLHHAKKVPIECTPENSFFPTVEDVKSRLHAEARLVCLCSPQNPTGRVIDKEVLKGICEAIVEENKKRKETNSRPCYLFFDQIYSDLSVGFSFVHPTKLCPEIREYLICVDGVSKSLCATGIRVGWVFGPQDIIGKMTELFSHIGAWAPKPEQNAVSRYLDEYEDMVGYIEDKKGQYGYIVGKICSKLEEMKETGFRVDCQRPEGGIYISIYLDYVNCFSSTENYLAFLINTCGLGIVPFEYFGSKDNKGWFRISIGNIDMDKIDELNETLHQAILKSHEMSNSKFL